MAPSRLAGGFSTERSAARSSAACEKRLAGLFSRRGFNIDTLAVGPTDDANISRITLTLDGAVHPIDQVTKQLHKLVNVIKIRDMEPEATVSREMALFKVSASIENRAEIMEFSQIFRAQIVDVSRRTMTIEVTGTDDKIDAFERMVRPHGLVEMARTGEVAIARSKLENEVDTIKGSLGDLTENIQRLRSQLREVEIQADAQLQARGDRLSRDSADFDPLEFDRYTRLQELTRMLAESVEDVAMVQSNMLKGLQLADADLAAQSRLTRELQQQLMRVRLVPFSNISERLYRVARQASKELEKRVNLEVRGASTELDRGVLERIGAPLEHLDLVLPARVAERRA